LARAFGVSWRQLECDAHAHVEEMAQEVNSWLNRFRTPLSMCAKLTAAAGGQGYGISSLKFTRFSHRFLKKARPSPCHGSPRWSSALHRDVSPRSCFSTAIPQNLSSMSCFGPGSFRLSHSRSVYVRKNMYDSCCL